MNDRREAEWRSGSKNQPPAQVHVIQEAFATTSGTLTPFASTFHPLQYNRTEAARALSISVRTLDRLISEKEILVRRIGRRVLITREALVSFTKRDHKLGVSR